MSDHLDDVDARILYLLQEDARNNTNAAISERVGVSASTVGNRIQRLEDADILEGYYPDIDYAQAGFPLHVLFICTVPITTREDSVADVRDLPGVIRVQELMTGDRNIHVEIVGTEPEDVTRMATTIDSLGVQVNEEVLVKQDVRLPANVLQSDIDGEDRRGGD